MKWESRWCRTEAEVIETLQSLDAQQAELAKITSLRDVSFVGFMVWHPADSSPENARLKSPVESRW